MSLLRNITSGLRSLFRKDQVDRELNEELGAYLEMEAAEKMREGMSRKDAVRAVRLERGGLELAKEVVRSGNWESFVETCWRDLRYGLRVLRKSPAFTLIALLTLTLGLGINCAIFTVVNAVLLRPLPYPNSERLVLVQRHFPEITFPTTSVTKFLFWREHSRDFESMTAYGFAFSGSGVNLTDAGEPEHLRSLRVSADFFRTLGVQPVLGRSFTEDEDRPGGPNAVVLSYALWQRRFGGDSGIVGRPIRLGGQLWTVVGVASKEFTFTPTADVWTPLRAQPNPNDQTNVCNVLGRLHPGASYAQVNQDVRALGEELRREIPDLMAPHETVAIRSYQDAIVGEVRPALLLLLGAVGFVLLIACANLANLLLSRATARRKEMAVRLALGADRLRLTRQLLIESSLLSVAGGGLGLAAASGLLPLLLRLSPQDLPRLGEVRVDWHVWTFAFAVALVTGIVFGLAPALQGPKAELRDALHESVGRASAGRATARLQRLLVISEVALSAVLLIGAALLIQTFWRLQHESPGFDARDVLTAQMTLDDQRFSKTAAVARLEDQGLTRLESLPGVQSAATVSNLPFEQGADMNFAIQENPSGGDPSGSTEWRAITRHYLQVMRIPVLRGRGLTDRDNASGAPVVLINQALAERFFPGQDPLGQHVVIGAGAEAMGLADRVREIVGIVGNTKEFGVAQPAPPTLFVPTAQVQDGLTKLVNQAMPLVWVVRTTGDPRLLARTVQQSLQGVATQEAPDNFRTMEDVLSASIAQQRFNMLLLALFAGLALALGGVGLCGVLSYLVAQRTHEMGIRMALGASRREVLRLIVRSGLRMTFIGLGIGIVAAVGLTRLLAGLLFGVKPTDPLTFGTVSLVLCGVAFVACYIPARRATRVDPIVALRYE
jgi:putative ABC transport system permease protein